MDKIKITEIMQNELMIKIEDCVRNVVRDELKENMHKKGGEYISAQKLCDRLGITKPTIHEWRKRGIIKSYKLGARVFYSWDEVQEAMTKIDN